MKTKYRVSVENTFLGPIASVPESLFVSGFSSKIVSTTKFDTFRNAKWFYFFVFFFWMLQEELVNNSTQTGRPSNTDENNNPDWMVFLNQNYECRLKSSTMGEMRLYPGHHKHAFSTCNRAIVSFVWANFQLIFISFDFGTICFAMIHVLIRVFHFMFGVCVADV